MELPWFSPNSAKQHKQSVYKDMQLLNQGGVNIQKYTLQGDNVIEKKKYNKQRKPIKRVELLIRWKIL